MDSNRGWAHGTLTGWMLLTTGWFVACAPPALELRTDSMLLQVHVPDGQQVPTFLREKLLTLRRCYEGALVNRPRLAGSLELTVTFEPGGKVKTYASDSQLPASLKRCFGSEIAGWRIAPQVRQQRFGPYVLTFAPRQGTPLTRPGRPVGQDPVARRPRNPPRPRARLPRARPKTVIKIRGHLQAYVPRVLVPEPASSRARAKIRARVYGLRRCFNRAVIRDRCLAGMVKISFTIARSGQTQNVAIYSTMPPPLLHCLRQKVKRWRLGTLPHAVSYGPFIVRFNTIPPCY